MFSPFKQLFLLLQLIASAIHQKKDGYLFFMGSVCGISVSADFMRRCGVPWKSDSDWMAGES